MGARYLIDSNAVIEFLGGMLPSASSNRLEDIVDQNDHSLSVINQIEVLGFNGPVAEMQILEEFVSGTTLWPLSGEIVQRTIALRKTYKIKLPDAIIAATALTHDLILITRNVSDFNKIEGLRLTDSHEL